MVTLRLEFLEYMRTKGYPQETVREAFEKTVKDHPNEGQVTIEVLTRDLCERIKTNQSSFPCGNIGCFAFGEACEIIKNRGKCPKR